MANWATLSDEIKEELLARKLNGEPVWDLAAHVGMNPNTLDRRLREFRQGGAGSNGVNGDHDEPVMIESSDPNNMVVSSQSDRITSLDDLMRVCNIDPHEWEVDHWIANTWEGFRKDTRKDLTWEGGVIQDGYVKDSGGTTTTTMYQIKAWLIRRRPIPIEPTIRPVALTPLPVALGRGSKKGVNHSLIIPDVHFGFKQERRKLAPFHDREALSIVLQACQATQFDNIVILGDMLDLADWSDKFLHSPDFEQMTQPALEEAAWFLWQLRKLQPKARISLLEGNHEKRLRDSIIRHVPQAYGIHPVTSELSFAAWSIPELLSLNAIGVEWVGDYPDGIVWLDDDLCAVHGMSLSADKVVNSTDVSVIFGHIHRYESAVRTVYAKRGPRVIVAYCPGFLGRMDGYVPGVKQRQRWSQGFAVVQHARGMDPQINHVAITGGMAVYQGAVLTGVDYVDHLREQIKEYAY